MKNVTRKLCAIMTGLVVGQSLILGASAAPTAPVFTTNSTYDVVLAISKTTTLTPIVNDSFEKTIAVTGFAGTDNECYCRIRYGFNDGAFSDTDYMYTGVKLGNVYKADVTTHVYVAGTIVNKASKGTTWTSYVTNGNICTKYSVKHSGTAYYYVSFAG